MWFDAVMRIDTGNPESATFPRCFEGDVGYMQTVHHVEIVHLLFHPYCI